MANAFGTNDPYTTNAFAPSAQTTQMLAPQTGTMYDPLIQLFGGISKQRQEEGVAADMAAKAKARTAIEDERYAAEQARQARLDARLKAGGQVDIGGKTYALSFNEETGKYDKQLLGNISDLKKADLASKKAKTAAAGKGSGFWTKPAGQGSATKSVAALFSGVNTIDNSDGSASMTFANQMDRDLVNATLAKQRELADYYGDTSAPRLPLLAKYAKDIAMGDMTEEDARFELDKAYGRKQTPKQEAAPQQDPKTQQVLADLNSGVIDEAEARIRLKALGHK